MNMYQICEIASLTKVTKHGLATFLTFIKYCLLYLLNLHLLSDLNNIRLNSAPYPSSVIVTNQWTSCATKGARERGLSPGLGTILCNVNRVSKTLKYIWKAVLYALEPTSLESDLRIKYHRATEWSLCLGSLHCFRIESDLGNCTESAIWQNTVCLLDNLVLE